MHAVCLRMASLLLPHISLLSQVHVPCSIGLLVFYWCAFSVQLIASFQCSGELHSLSFQPFFVTTHQTCFVWNRSSSTAMPTRLLVWLFLELSTEPCPLTRSAPSSTVCSMERLLAWRISRQWQECEWQWQCAHVMLVILGCCHCFCCTTKIIIWQQQCNCEQQWWWLTTKTTTTTMNTMTNTNCPSHPHSLHMKKKKNTTQQTIQNKKNKTLSPLLAPTVPLFWDCTQCCVWHGSNVGALLVEQTEHSLLVDIIVKCSGHCWSIHSFNVSTSHHIVMDVAVAHNEKALS